MKALVTVRINVGLKRWQEETILVPMADDTDEIYEWLYDYFRDKYTAVSPHLHGYYPAMNKVPKLFRIIKIDENKTRKI